MASKNMATSPDTNRIMPKILMWLFFRSTRRYITPTATVFNIYTDFFKQSMLVTFTDCFLSKTVNVGDFHRLFFSKNSPCWWLSPTVFFLKTVSVGDFHRLFLKKTVSVADFHWLFFNRQCRLPSLTVREPSVLGIYTDCFLPVSKGISTLTVTLLMPQ
jgi:hypothetical protein